MVLVLSTTPKMMTHPVQHIAESTEGTTPGAGSMTAIPVKTLDLNIDGVWENVDTLGGEDLTDQDRVDGVQGFRLSGPGNAAIFDLFKWLINAQDFTPAAGTIWEPKSFLTAIKLQGSASPTYLLFKGVKPLSGSWKKGGAKMDQVDIEYGCVEMADPTTTAPAGLTLTTTFPAGPFYRGGDAAGVFNWNAVAYKYREWTVNVNRNIDRVVAGGADIPFTQAPIGRGITAQIKALWNDLVLYNDWKAKTKRTATFGVASGKTITGGTNNALLTKCALPLDAGSTEVQAQSWDMTLFSASA